jgi:hypothetical protein
MIAPSLSSVEPNCLSRRELVQATSRDKQLYQVQYEEAERRAKAAEALVEQLQSNVDTLKIMLQEEQARPNRNDQVRTGRGNLLVCAAEYHAFVLV